MDTLNRVKEVVADKLDVNVEDISPEKAFIADLGADSLDIVELVMGLEDEFGLEINDDEAEAIITVEDAMNFIDSKQE